MTARDEVLGRIRTALGGARPGPAPPGDRAADEGAPGDGAPGDGAPGDGAPGDGASGDGAGAPPAYRTRGELDTRRLLDLLTERLIDYHSKVRRAPAGQLRPAIRAALAQRGARRLVLPPGLELPGLDLPGLDLPGLGLPGPDLPGGVELVVDNGLSAAALDAFDGVITGAAVAIAETGTIVLDGSPGQGRRALSLIPDYHLCILHAAQVVALVPEAVQRLSPGRPLTWISGPSATSDIELDRVEGVHGPRTLEVILVEPPEAF
jgi:L-lactate dehydrogenase complex protein LldG